MAGRIVHIDREFEPLEVEPVVGRIEQRAEQRSTDAAAVVVVVDAEPEAGHMAATAPGQRQARHADDPAVKQGDDPHLPVRRLVQPGPGLFPACERHPQRAEADFGQRHHVGDLLPVAGLGGADGQAGFRTGAGWKRAAGRLWLCRHGALPVRCAVLERKACTIMALALGSRIGRWSAG
jgi:hypothetical protein